MGIKLHFILGAGIRIDNPTVKKVKTVRKCPTLVHETDEGDYYCRTCGEQIREIQQEYFENVYIEDIIGNNNFFRCIYPDGRCYIFSNKEHKNGQLETLYDDHSVITQEKIDECINEFKETHKEDIKKLEDYLGYNVTIEFLFFNYFS